jgi:hypothetical protein
MTTTQWVITATVALIGGGAMGAVITAVVARYRNRRQPVAYTMETIEIFKRNPEFQSMQALLLFGDEDMGSDRPAKRVDNLSVVRVSLINRGNQDLERFSFGATLSGTDQAIEVRTETPDRHHVVEIAQEIDLAHPAAELDFTLHPFNRGDKYKVSIFFTYIEAHKPILLSTPHTTKFIESASGKVGLEALVATYSKFLVQAIALIVTLLLVLSLNFAVQFLFDSKIESEKQQPPLQRESSPAPLSR